MALTRHMKLVRIKLSLEGARQMLVCRDEMTAVLGCCSVAWSPLTQKVREAYDLACGLLTEEPYQGESEPADFQTLRQFADRTIEL